MAVAGENLNWNITKLDESSQIKVDKCLVIKEK